MRGNSLSFQLVVFRLEFCRTVHSATSSTKRSSECCWKSYALWNGNGGSDVKTGGKNGSCRVENGEVGTGSDKKGQDKKRIRERDRENCKVGRQTSGCKATLVGTRKKKRRKLHGKKNGGDCGAK